MKELIEIQSKLNAPKNQRNNFGKYNYRSCEDILEAVKPLLKEQGCLLRIEDTITMVGERHYIKATATVSKEDQSVAVSAFAREPLNKKGMDESQITGATSSYARKYALNGLFLIDDSKDSDVTSTEGLISIGMSSMIESLLDTSVLSDEDADAIRGRLNTMAQEQGLKCIAYLKDNQVDPKQRGNMSAKETNNAVLDKLNDPKA